MSYYAEGKTIPEKLGFAPISRDRKDPFSTVSYQAQYILYEDEAEDLLRRYLTHQQIEAELNRRYIHEQEYRERVNGGYDAMQKKMRDAGLISDEEQAIIDRLNGRFPPPHE